MPEPTKVPVHNDDDDDDGHSRESNDRIASVTAIAEYMAMYTARRSHRAAGGVLSAMAAARSRFLAA